MQFVVVSSIVEANGKTVRENNMEKLHSIPIGTLVEIIPWDEDSTTEYAGLRLRISHHGRDCDGTPLYGLGFQRWEGDQRGMEWQSVLHGFEESCLRIATR